MRCLLASREKVPAALQRVRGEGTEQAQQQPPLAWAVRWAGRYYGPSSLLDWRNPIKFFLPTFLDPSFSLSHFCPSGCRGVAISFLSATQLLEFVIDRARCDRHRKCRRRLALLDFKFDTLHRSLFGVRRLLLLRLIRQPISL